MSEPDGQAGDGPADQAPGQGGPGGHSARTESGVTAIREQRLIGKALRGNWLGQRFPTSAKLVELHQLVVAGEANLRDRAVIGAWEGLESRDERVKQRAVTNVGTMERVNQADEFAARGLAIEGTNVNVNITGISLESREDFYGNAAHALAAQAAAASGSDHGVTSAVQAGGVRPAIREDGGRNDVDASGTRPEAGRFQGSD